MNGSTIYERDLKAQNMHIRGKSISVRAHDNDFFQASSIVNYSILHSSRQSLPCSCRYCVSWCSKRRVLWLSPSQISGGSPGPLGKKSRLFRAARAHFRTSIQHESRLAPLPSTAPNFEPMLSLAFSLGPGAPRHLNKRIVSVVLHPAFRLSLIILVPMRSALQAILDEGAHRSNARSSGRSCRVITSRPQHDFPAEGICALCGGK